MTTLERALAMLQSKTEDPSLFSALLQRLTDAEVFVALEKSPSGKDITPKTVLFENLEVRYRNNVPDGLDRTH